MYRLHDALGYCARPSRRSHACRLGITPAGACRAHVATGFTPKLWTPGDGGRPRMRYVSKATTALGASLGAAAGAAQCHGTAPGRGRAVADPRLRAAPRVGFPLFTCCRFLLFIPFSRQVSRVCVSFLYDCLFYRTRYVSPVPYVRMEPAGRLLTCCCSPLKRSNGQRGTLRGVFSPNPPFF